jgi:hypothetical protein
MDRQTRPRHPHRRNADGSHDSICTACLATIASVRDESELADHELAHVCNPFWSALPAKYPTTFPSSLLERKPIPDQEGYSWT